MGRCRRAGLHVAALLVSGIALPVELRADDGSAGTIDGALLTCAVTANCAGLAMTPDEALEFLEMSQEQAKEAHDRQSGMYFENKQAVAPEEMSSSEPPTDRASSGETPTEKPLNFDESDLEGGVVGKNADTGEGFPTQEPMNFEESDLQASDRPTPDETADGQPLDFSEDEGDEFKTGTAKPRTMDDSVLRCAAGFGCNELADYIGPDDAAIFLEDEQKKAMCAAGHGCIQNFKNYTPEQMRKELGLTEDKAIEDFAHKVGEKPGDIDPSYGASGEDPFALCMRYQKQTLEAAYAMPAYRAKFAEVCREWLATDWRPEKWVVDQLGRP